MTVIVMPGVCAPQGHESVNEKLVEHLEDLLADAKTGRLQSLAWAGVFVDGMHTINWTGSASTASLGGAIRRLDFEYVSAQGRPPSE